MPHSLAPLSRSQQWTPAFLVIDEFQDFADEEKTPEMLRLAREYNLGVVIAHQNMFCAELNDDIRNAISTNTSIKYAASPEGGDLNYMARDMRCEPDFLKTQTKQRQHRQVRLLRARHEPHASILVSTWNSATSTDGRKCPMTCMLASCRAQRDALQARPKVIQNRHSLYTRSRQEQPSAPEQHKPRREPDTPTQPPAKSAPTDPHTGDHTEPASKWGDQ